MTTIARSMSEANNMCDLVTEEEIDNVFSMRYFNLIKKTQVLCGLWPYHSTWWKIFVKILIYLILFVATIPLSNGFRIWCGKNFNNICSETILGLLYTLAIFVKYYHMSLSEKKLKKLYQSLTLHWLSITDPVERAIMVKYAKIGRTYIISYIVYMTVAGLSFSQIPAIPVVLDIIFPLNESRSKILFVKAEYIIDPYEHYNKLYLYFCVATALSGLCIVSADTTYCVIVYQILGIISVVKHRLKVATKFEDGKNSYNIVATAITLHQESIKFVGLIDASFSIVFLVIVVGTAIFISSGVIILINMNHPLDMIRFAPLEIGVVLHILYLSFIAQKVLDSNYDLFTAIYSIDWYNCSKKSKNLLKFMMLRTTKPCILTAGGFYIMSIQNFGIILKTAVSYTTVLLSLG